MSYRLVSAFALAALVAGTPALASDRVGVSADPLAHVGYIPDPIPIGVASYGSSASAIGSAPHPAREGTPRLKIALHGEPAFELRSTGERRLARENKVLPIVLSAILPGAGEIYLARKRRSTGLYLTGAALIAAEAAAWTGYGVYNSRGLDRRKEFEAFADAHWDYDKWIIDHPAVETFSASERTFARLDSVGQDPNWDEWPPYHPYAAKDDVKLNYYENIGKYDWFISGWDDWDPASKPEHTLHRQTYRDLRKESNDALDTSKRFIFLSVAARVYSLIHTTILATRDGEASPSESDAGNVILTARATGLDSGEIALEYWFR